MSTVPAHETHVSFRDFALNTTTFMDIDVRKKSVVLYLSDSASVHRVILKNSALNQFLRLIGFDKIKEAKKAIRRHPDILLSVVLNKIRRKDYNGIIISAVEHPEAPGVWIAYRVTTPDYTPIPHRILFDFVEGVLRQMGVEYSEKKIVKFMKRTAVRFLVAEYPLRYARVGDALRVYLVVSNANNAQDSIHVYGYVEILACSNGLISTRHGLAVHIAHRGNIADILARVKTAVEKVLANLRERYRNVAHQIEQLENVPVSKELIWMWLQLMFRKNKIPRKYHKWFQRVLEQYTSEFGYNAEAMFQTLTYFVARLRNKNVDLVRRLNNEAQRLLEAPVAYVEAIVKTKIRS